MKRLWSWLRDEHNRGAIGLIGAGLAAAIGAAWTLFLYIESRPEPETESGSNPPAVTAPQVTPDHRNTESLLSGDVTYQSEFEARKTDELTLSRLGEKAFEDGEWQWAIKSFEQADAVKASGVWQSRYPYYIAALYKSNRPNDAQSATAEMLHRIESTLSDGSGYLGHDTSLGFLIRNLGNAKARLSGNARGEFDSLIEEVVELKRQAN